MRPTVACLLTAMLTAMRLALLAASSSPRAEAAVGAPGEGAVGAVEALVRVIQASRAPAPALVLRCQAGRGGRALARALAATGVAVGVVDRAAAWLPALQARAGAPDKAALNVILDAGCPEAPRLLAQADGMDMFRSRRRWVLHGLGGGQAEDGAEVGAVGLGPAYRLAADAPSGAALERCYRHVAALLEGLAVLVDSDVSAVCAAGGSEDGDGGPTATAVAVSAYRVWRGAELKLQVAARWRAGAGLAWADWRPIAKRRLDMDGYVVNVVFVVYNKADLKRNIAEGRLSADFFTSFFWDMVHDMVRMLNGTMNATITNTWGYLPKGSTPTEGSFGMQIQNQAEIGGTGYSLILDPLRQKYLQFTNFICPASGAIVFRAPPMSYENNVFTMPFPLSLWEAALGMVAVCLLLLMAALRIEQLGADDGGDDQHALLSGSDALLLALAAVCQQGSPIETQGVPGRIITLMLFLLVLLLYTCYSASIVVLLQSTSSNINHFKDLLDSKMTLGAVNISYVRLYLSREDDPMRQRIFNEKVVRGRKPGGNWYSVAEGVRRAQSEYFAFFGVESSINEEISRTWLEHEKCGLITIGRDFMRVRDPQVTITKTSHNSEAFMIMLRRLSERGIWHRMNRKYGRAKPPCANHAAVFNSVSLTDVRGAFYVLLALMAASLLVLLLELAVHRRQRARGARPPRKAPALVGPPPTGRPG